MDFIADILHYRFMVNALWACVLSGVVCGLLGTYIVCRRMVFMSGGITHASFGGIGIAYWMGADPVAGALVFSVLSALGVEVASRRGAMREDSAIGIIWSVGMAVGIIFIYLTPGYAPNLMSFLFGNILTVTRRDIVSLAALAAVAVAVFALFMRRIMYVAFDRDYARSQGVATEAINYAMSVMVALAIVFSIRTVGIMLLISLLTIPATIVNTVTHNYRSIFPLAAAVAVIGNLAGLVLSVRLDVPASAATIFTLAVGLLMVKILTLLRKKRGRPKA